MKKMKLAIGMTSIVFILLLTSCGATQKLPDMSSLGAVTAISREEGSGTRAEFESLIGSKEEGANHIALSTDEVLEQVASDRNAIGYLAASTIKEESRVKTLSVDGVVLSTETISKGNYPLCRNYVLAYTGDLNAVETDFLTYIQSAGQTIVAESCIPLAKATTFLSDQSPGEITIHGSSSVSPLMEQLIAGYFSYNPNAVITVTTSDSTSGLNDAMRGDCDLAMSSRSLKDYETELLKTETIAADGMAVIVNAENPLEGLTCEQIRSLYDGSIQNWSALK